MYNIYKSWAVVAHACNPSYQEAEIRKMRPYHEEPFTKIGLVEWLKVKALSSSPSIAKKKKKIYIYIYLKVLYISLYIYCI
jgi:hypothetical protein